MAIPHDLLAEFTLEEFRRIYNAYRDGFEEACCFFREFKRLVIACNNSREEWDTTDLRLHLNGAKRQRDTVFDLLRPDFPHGKNRYGVFAKLTTMVSDGGVDVVGRLHSSAHEAAYSAMTMATCLESACGNQHDALSKWQEHPSLFPHGDGTQFDRQAGRVHVQLDVEAARIEAAYAENEKHSMPPQVGLPALLGPEVVLEKCGMYRRERQAFKEAYFRMQGNPENHDQDGWIWTYEMREIADRIRQIATMICAFGKQAGVQVDAIEESACAPNYDWPAEDSVQIRRVEFAAEVQLQSIATGTNNNRNDSINAPEPAPAVDDTQVTTLLRSSMRWEKAKETAEAHCKRNPFPGVNGLMRIVGCSKGTIRKAIKHSPMLKARQAEQERKSQSVSAKGMTKGVAASAQSPERDPSEAAADKTDSLLHRLMESANAEQRALLETLPQAERDRLEAMPEDQQIEFLTLMMDNPDADQHRRRAATR